MQKERKWSVIREYFGLKYVEAAISFFIVFFIFIPLLKIRKNKKGKDFLNKTPNSRKKLLLYGAYGNQSVGDDAILQSILENIDNDLYEVIVSSYKPYLTEKMTTHKIIWQGRTLDGLFYMYKTLKTTDILIFGGGGVLETHNNSFITTIGMMYKFSKVYLAKLMGVKVYCFAIGSNTKPYSKAVRLLVETLLDNIDGISTRDRKSFEFLKKIKPDLKIKSLADPALLLGIDDEVSKDNRIEIGINVMPYYKLLNGDKSKLQHIRQEIARSLDLAIKNFEAWIYFIPMVEGDDTTEQEAIYEFVKNKDKVKIMSPNYTPNELMKLLKRFDLFVGTRLHPNILAYNVNTPIVGIAYHDKIFSLFDHIKQPKYVQSIQNVSSEILVNQIKEVLDNKESIKSQMKNRQNELISLAKESFSDLSEI